LTLVVTARDMAKMLRQRPPLGQAILTLATHSKRTLKTHCKTWKCRKTLANNCGYKMSTPTDRRQTIFWGKIKFKLVASETYKKREKKRRK